MSEFERHLLNPVFVTTLGVLGLLLGSFLNVVIHRVPRDESIVSPPSHCPQCNHAIAWYENIPVLSWLWLRGKCSGCQAPISPRYALVELLTGFLFLAAYARFGWGYGLVPALCFICLVVPLVFIDAELWILPFELTLPGLVLGLVLRVPMGWPAVQDGLWGAGVAFLAFRLMEWGGWLALRKEALGAGDKFLMALLGAFLGWKPLLGIILLSSVQGAVWGIASLLITGRAGPAMPQPEGPTPQGGRRAARGSSDAEEPPLTFTPEFLLPGLPLWKRLLLFPYTVFLQPIPDDPPLPEGAAPDAEPEWTPGATNLPFGPWIGLAGLEVLLLGPFLSQLAGHTLLGAALQLIFPS